MKLFFTLLFALFVCVSAYSFTTDLDTEKDTTKTTKVGFEFFVLPTLWYNSASFGINFSKNKRIEHSFNLGIRVLPSLYLYPHNINFTYNLNRYFKNNKNYLPFWFRIKNTMKYTAEGESETTNPNSLRLSIGTGIGRLSRMSKNWFFRSEFGFGVSLNFINYTNKEFPGPNWLDYSITKNPQNSLEGPILPAFRFKLGFVRRNSTIK